MLGYWRNDVATTEVKRDGWPKIDDMGRLDADGFLYIVGRRSDMIKAGSHRIHPQDIDLEAEANRIAERLREITSQTLRRRGLVVAISGGVEGRVNHFKLIAQSPNGEQREERLNLQDHLQIVAATNFKQRLRKTLEYFHADRLNYAVVGTPTALALWAHNHQVPAAELGTVLGLSEQKAQFIYDDIEAKRRATKCVHRPPVLIEDVNEIEL